MSSVKSDLNCVVNASSQDETRRFSRLRGVLFDKDGTLIDFQRTWGPAIHAVIHALAGGDAEKIRAQAECLHFNVETRRFRATSPIIGGATSHYGPAWALALGRTDLAALRGEIDTLAAAACMDSLTPVGEPARTLQALRTAGLKVGLATNDAEASARRHLAQLELTEMMDFVAGYDSGHGAKPEAGMVLAFAREIGAEPEEIALVGDSLHDLESARAAGAIAVAVLSGVAGREDLAPHADYVVADISVLPALFAIASADSARDSRV
jgi:phosphoglycolate phosphatase